MALPKYIIERKLYYSSVRLATFTDGTLLEDNARKAKWPHKDPEAKSLAKYGFFFSPKLENLDQVTCFFCGGHESSLNRESDIVGRHFSHNPNCLLATIWHYYLLYKRDYEKGTFWDRQRGNGADKSVVYPHSRPAVNLRLKTFENMWKFGSRKQIKETTKKFAKAGFFYSPKNSDDDSVICMYCGWYLTNADGCPNPLQKHNFNGDFGPLQPECHFLSTLGGYLVYKNYSESKETRSPAVEDLSGGKRKKRKKNSSKSSRSSISEDFSPYEAFTSMTESHSPYIMSQFRNSKIPGNNADGFNYSFEESPEAQSKEEAGPKEGPKEGPEIKKPKLVDPEVSSISSSPFKSTALISVEPVKVSVKLKDQEDSLNDNQLAEDSKVSHTPETQSTPEESLPQKISNEIMNAYEFPVQEKFTGYKFPRPGIRERTKFKFSFSLLGLFSFGIHYQMSKKEPSSKK